ncbi:MAG: ABC transporter ATP-binding protein [Pseudomonadota bacterium]
MIEAKTLTRTYGDFVAVSDVSFSIQEGEVVGLLGHNGAGKTTVMKMLTGFLEPTSGVASVGGFDVSTDRRSAQAMIGYLPENCPVYPEMAVLDYLDYAASLRGVEPGKRASEVARVIAATNLEEKARAPISALSRGLRQRVGVAQAIIGSPKYIILDEPTNGLDPSQIKQMRALIKDLATSATVILSTHILQEVQAVCDRAIIIDRGRLAVDSTLAELQSERRMRIVSSFSPVQVAQALGDTAADIKPASADGAGIGVDVAISSEDGAAFAADAARKLVSAGADLFELTIVKRDLETLFSEISRERFDADQETGINAAA